MFCTACGKKLEDGYQYCPVCGKKADEGSVVDSGANDVRSVAATVHVPTYNTSRGSTGNNAIVVNSSGGVASNDAHFPSQSWLRFLTSKLLPLAALLLLVLAASFYFGLIYTFADVSRVRIYDAFPTMKIVDRVVAIGTLATAALSVATRKSLKWHHSNALTLATMFFASCLALFLLYGVAVSVVIGRFAFDTYSLLVVAASSCFIALNLIYLRKRRNLFVVP